MATLSLGPCGLHGPQILGCLLSVHSQTFADSQSVGMCVLLEGCPWPVRSASAFVGQKEPERLCPWSQLSCLSLNGKHSHSLSLGPYDSNGEGNGTPLQYSCLENPMDRGAWWAAVHGVAKSQRRLSDFTFTLHFHALEKEMATHSMFLPGESQGRGSLVGCSPWGHTESDTTEVT